MHKNKHLLIFFIIIGTFGNLRAQDHLEPIRGVFDIYDYQFEYYLKVREILFEGLSDDPETRYLVMPSFTGENVLDISKDNTDKYSIEYHVAEPSIWHSIQDKKKKVKVKVEKIKKEISTEDAQLITLLFKKAVANVKYPDKKIYGFDGVNYYFTAQNQSGQIWSPQSGSKMAKLVEIGNRIITFAKSNEVELDKELVAKIKNLINEL